MLHINSSDNSPNTKQKDEASLRFGQNSGDVHINIHMQQPPENSDQTVTEIQAKLDSLTAITDKLTQTLQALAKNSNLLVIDEKVPEKEKYVEAGISEKSESVGKVRSRSVARSVAPLSHDEIDLAAPNDKVGKVKEKRRYVRKQKPLDGEIMDVASKVADHQLETKRQYRQQYNETRRLQYSETKRLKMNEVPQISQEKRRPGGKLNNTTGFNQFTSERIGATMKEYKLRTSGEALKVLGPMWMSMTKEQQKPYRDQSEFKNKQREIQDKAIKDRLDHQQEIVSSLKDQEADYRLDYQQKKVSFLIPEEKVVKTQKVDKVSNHSSEHENSITYKLNGLLGKRSPSESSSSNSMNYMKSKSQRTSQAMVQVHKNQNEEMFNQLTQDSSVTELFDQNVIGNPENRVKREITLIEQDQIKEQLRINTILSGAQKNNQENQVNQQI